MSDNDIICTVTLYNVTCPNLGAIWCPNLKGIILSSERNVIHRENAIFISLKNY